MPHPTVSARRWLARAVLLSTLLLANLAVGSGPAAACACGAFLADAKLRATQETALVELDGRTESITLNIAAETEARRAAFIMPVPARARFELAQAAVFAELDEISRPRVEYREVVIDGEGSGGAAPGSEPTVTDHVTVGPYEVAQLTGTDSTAVTDWLAANDFTLPDDLAGALSPYLAEGWLVVAVQLTPETGTFADGLPPMRLSFDTDAPVYPMRLSATAEYRQPVRLYVLADHRYDISNPTTGDPAPELTYADHVRADALGEYPALAALVDRPRFLTRYDAVLDPLRITDDIRLTRASTDDTFRAVVVRNRYVTSAWPDTPTLLAIAAAVLAAGAAVTVLVVRTRRRERVAPTA